MCLVVCVFVCANEIGPLGYRLFLFLLNSVQLAILLTGRRNLAVLGLHFHLAHHCHRASARSPDLSSPLFS